MIQNNVEQRKRLNQGIFVPTEDHERFAQLEKAFAAFHETKGIHKKVEQQLKRRKLKNLTQLIFTHKVLSKILSLKKSSIMWLCKQDGARGDPSR